MLFPQLQRRSHLGDIANEGGILPAGEMAIPHDGGHIIHLAPFGDPFLQPAIQHRHIGMAENPEHPPDTGRGKQPVLIIDHDTMTITDPHRPHTGDEFLHRRQHMRQRGGSVGDFINIEEPRLGDMGGIIIRTRITALTGQPPCRVNHPDIRRREVIRQP